MPDAIRSTISFGNHLRVFSVYISLLISRVHPIKETTLKKDGLFSFMRKNVLLAEFGSKEFSVQTSDMLH